MKLVSSVENKEHVFIIIRSFFTIQIITKDNHSHHNFFSAKKWLRKQSIGHVYFHYLSIQAALLIHNIQVGFSTWIVWGADYYNFPLVRNNYHQKAQSKGSFIRDLIQKKYVSKVMHQLDFIASNITDQEEIQENIQLRAEFKRLDNFFSVRDFSDRIQAIQGSYILVGNSDDSSNNHIEGLSQLDKNTDRTILIPLSGVSNTYTQKVIQFAKDRFSNVMILDDFLSSEAYYRLLGNVESVIYPHFRQQGRGTVMPLLYHGRKVYLFERNPLYRLFKKWGLVVFSLDKKEELIGIDKPLTISEIEHNQKLLETLLSVESINKQWRHILCES